MAAAEHIAVMKEGAQVEEERVWDDVRDDTAMGSGDTCRPCGEDVTMGPAEEAPVRIARDPGDPTEEEFERHCVTHLPYRSLCPLCVKARGREDDHKRICEEDKSDKPVVGLDYKSFGQADDSDDKITQVVMRDAISRITFAHTCDTKDSADQ